MPSEKEFSEYAISLSSDAKSERDNLLANLRSILDIITDDLSEDPDKYPDRITQHPENEDTFIYKYPDPNLQVTFKINSETKRIDIIHIANIKLEVRKPLFISYNHEDKKWLKELKKWLFDLEQNDLIKIWSDQEIKPGTKWRKEIEQALCDAKVALLLISQDFLVSNFINNNELPQIFEKANKEGLKILWIAVRESTVEESFIDQFQAIHKEPPLKGLRGNAREKAFKEIYYRIKEAVEQESPN